MEYSISHSTKPLHMYERYLGQIWAHLVQNWASETQKTVYVVTLLVNCIKMPPRALRGPISQHWVSSAKSAIHHFKAEILPIPKWYSMLKSINFYYEKLWFKFFQQFILLKNATFRTAKLLKIAYLITILSEKCLNHTVKKY